MKKVLEILHVEHKTSKKGTAYSLAQCVIRNEDGSAQVGELFLDPSLKDTPKGLYEADWELAVDFDKRVTAKCVALRSVGAKVVPAARAA